jgi:hypothetical protein
MRDIYTDHRPMGCDIVRPPFCFAYTPSAMLVFRLSSAKKAANPCKENAELRESEKAAVRRANRRRQKGGGGESESESAEKFAAAE